VTGKPPLSDLAVTHKHEEKLRAESMALIHASVELSWRLLVIEKAMKVIFGYTIEHTSRSENEATVQLLGIRLFNAAASGMKLARFAPETYGSNRVGSRELVVGFKEPLNDG
jgi:hypothetical protein